MSELGPPSDPKPVPSAMDTETDEEPTPAEGEEAPLLAPDEDDPETILHAEYLAETIGMHREKPCTQELPPDAHMLDSTKRLLEETLCAATLWADSLFGVPGDIEAARRVHGHIEVSGGYSQFEGSKVRVRLNVRAKLPSLKNRLNAFIGRDNENDFLRDRSEGFALRSQFPRVDDREGWLGGLGYGLPETDRLRSQFRIGVHGLRPPKAFVQWRTRYNIYADEFNVFYIRATPFWNSVDGGGITTNFDMSHVLAPTRLLRLSTAATRSQSTAGIDWRNAVILYQNLREGRAVALEAFVRGATQADEPLGEYGLRTIFRQPLLQQRLFLELVLGYSWPRNDPALPRNGSIGSGASLDMPFGRN